MAVTLNANTSTGFIATSDTSGVLQLQTGGTTAVSISAAQVVTLTNALPVASGGSGVTTSTGTGANVLGTTPSFTSTIGVGGATASASGSGISFPATQSASTDANTLDDYEEGTWTPTYSGITGSPTSIARYVKVGRQVTLTYEQTGGTFTCTGGSGIITGIPFLGVGGTGVVSACGAISNTAVTSALALYNASTSGSLYVTASFSAAGGVGFSITYFV